MLKHYLFVGVIVLLNTISVEMKIHSEQETSKTEEDDDGRYAEQWDQINRKATLEPYIRSVTKKYEKDYDEDKQTNDKKKPNQMFFPLVYKQNHVKSMFKIGDSWYTWSTERPTDGSKLTNYYVCLDDPKRCDDLGWEHTHNPPKCAFHIDSMSYDDRVCLYNFGVEAHNRSICDNNEFTKVSDVLRLCGPRITSLWRFVRVGPRSNDAVKPSDINSLMCEDEEECHITVEYRIHHDRISFSIHEPNRSLTFKTIMKRDNTDDQPPVVIKNKSYKNKKTRKPEPHKNKVKKNKKDIKANARERVFSKFNQRSNKNKDISENSSI